MNSRPLSEASPVPEQWAWHYQALQSLRDRLLTETEGQLAEAAEPVEAHSLHPADSGSDEYDHEFALRMLAMEQSTLGELDAAMERIRLGSYGICEETGTPIPAERLRAIPWARCTRTVQARHEREDASEHKGAAGTAQP